MFKLKHFPHTLAFLLLVYFSMFSLAAHDVSLCGNFSEGTDKLVVEDWILDEDEDLVGNLCLLSGQILLNGNRLTVEGNLIQPGGEMIVNGNLEILGDYLIQSFINGSGGESEGKLRMNSADSVIFVDENFVTQSKHDHLDLLTNGELTINGNFEQRCSGNPDCEKNFYASGEHLVILAGDMYSSVSFETPGSGKSRFNKLEKTGDISNFTGCFVKGATCESYLSGFNVIDSPITLERDEVYSNDLYLKSGASIDFAGHTLTVQGDLYIRDGAYLDLAGHTLKVRGDLLLEGGTLMVNDGKLEVGNNFRAQAKEVVVEGATPNYSDSWAYIAMNNPSGIIEVGGDFYMRSMQVNEFFAGTIFLKGDFHQIKGEPANFAASGTHKVVFNGVGGVYQLVSFDSHDIESGSHFAGLEIRNCNMGFADASGSDYGYTEYQDTCGVDEEPPEEEKPSDEEANDGELCEEGDTDCGTDDTKNPDDENTSSCDEENDVDCGDPDLDDDNIDDCGNDANGCSPDDSGIDDGKGDCSSEDKDCGSEDDVNSDNEGAIDCEDGVGENCEIVEDEEVVVDWGITEDSFVCGESISMGCDSNKQGVLYENGDRWKPKTISKVDKVFYITSDNSELAINFADEVLTQAELTSRSAGDVAACVGSEILAVSLESHAHNKKAQTCFNLEAASWYINLNDVKTKYQVALSGSMGRTFFGLSNIDVSGEKIELDFKLLPGVEQHTKAILQFSDQGVELSVYKQTTGSAQYLFIQGTVLPNNSELSFFGRNINIKTSFSTKQSADEEDEGKIDKLKVAKE